MNTVLQGQNSGKTYVNFQELFMKDAKIKLDGFSRTPTIIVKSPELDNKFIISYVLRNLKAL